jgi:hypothetical protein
MMKTNAKRKNSAMKKLVPAAGMLALSASMLATSTYAWFTMNKTVTVTGMEMKTVVGDSLLIAPSEADTVISADSAFTNGINQSVYGVLQPVSTINAADTGFYYTYDAKADGSKATSTATNPYTLVSSNTITVDSNTYKAYVDYVFEIKAINSDATAKELRLTKLNLLYDGVAVNEHSYRVAVFQQDESETAYAARPVNANKIFAPSGFTYFDGTAVTSTTDKAAVSQTVNGSTWTKSIPANSTNYTQLTFRFWLEGEDTDCYSAKYLDLTKEWTLDLKFDLASGSSDTETAAAVQTIGSNVNASATTAGVASLSGAGETAVSYQWYTDNAGALLDTAVPSQTSATYGGNAGDKVYCVITTAKGTKYRTNTIEYTP